MSKKGVNPEYFVIKSRGVFGCMHFIQFTSMVIQTKSSLFIREFALNLPSESGKIIHLSYRF
jgi:hypothetical protein